MRYDLFDKNVRVKLITGEEFTGNFSEIFEEDNSILVGSTEIYIKGIDSMEEI